MIVAYTVQIPGIVREGWPGIPVTNDTRMTLAAPSISGEKVRDVIHLTHKMLRREVIDLAY